MNFRKFIKVEAFFFLQFVQESHMYANVDYSAPFLLHGFNCFVAPV